MKITSRPGDDLQNHLDAEFRQFCEDTHVMDWDDVQMAFGSLNVLLRDYNWHRAEATKLRDETEVAMKLAIAAQAGLYQKLAELDRKTRAVEELLRDYSDAEQEEFWNSIDT